MSIAQNLLLSKGAAQRAVSRCVALMQGTRKGEQHTWSRSAYQHALAWQRGIERLDPLATLARSYTLYRAAVKAAIGRAWRAHKRVEAALRRLTVRVEHTRYEYRPRLGVGMVFSAVPYVNGIGGDGRCINTRQGRGDAIPDFSQAAAILARA